MRASGVFRRSGIADMHQRHVVAVKLAARAMVDNHDIRAGFHGVMGHVGQFIMHQVTFMLGIVVNQHHQALVAVIFDPADVVRERRVSKNDQPAVAHPVQFDVHGLSPQFLARRDHGRGLPLTDQGANIIFTVVRDGKRHSFFA